jgi:hypothetical protein
VLSKQTSFGPGKAAIVSSADCARWKTPFRPKVACPIIGKTNDAGIVSSDTILPELIGDWKTYLKSPDQKDFLESVHRDSSVNRPLGDAAFVDSLEQRHQLKMTRGKPGRPAVRSSTDQIINQWLSPIKLIFSNDRPPSKNSLTFKGRAGVGMGFKKAGCVQPLFSKSFILLAFSAISD